MRKLSLDEFITKARNVHGDKYDYSKVEYINKKTKVCIICHKHGEFWQTPAQHTRGKGCIKCGYDKSKRPIGGVGILDIARTENKKAYSIWASMIDRCYSHKGKRRLKPYFECSVCEEWHIFSNFRRWFEENYVEGFDLDKDILAKDCKIYSPDTCCFIPHEINTLFIHPNGEGKTLPVGVCYRKTINRYYAYMSSHNNKRCLGCFKSPQEAFLVYKKTKEMYIKQLAEKYYQEGKIAQKVYEALMRYEVEPQITSSQGTTTPFPMQLA